jgi:hypothetical protein
VRVERDRRGAGCSARVQRTGKQFYGRCWMVRSSFRSAMTVPFEARWATRKACSRAFEQRLWRTSRRHAVIQHIAGPKLGVLLIVT